MLIPFNNIKDRRGREELGLWARHNIKPKGVLHIGANRGEEAPVYLGLGVAKQMWFEANPYLFERLTEAIKGNQSALAYNFCIGDREGEQTILHEANNQGQSSSILALGTHKQQHPDVHYVRDIPVTMRRIDALIPIDAMKEYDFLNIDIQGAELMALVGMGDHLQFIKWAYIEVNRANVYEGCPLVEDIDLYLAGFGFKRVETKWIGNWGDALYVK